MAGLIWKVSPWDHRVHAFRELGEIASEAICQHCAPTSRLGEPTHADRRCLGCLLVHGDDLVDRHADRVGDRDLWAP
jgi:hypothetical protein